MDSITNKLEVLRNITSKDYDPVIITDVAEKLILFGKGEALTLLDKFTKQSDMSSDDFGLFLLLRIMFDVPNFSEHPKINIGKFDFDEPTNASDNELFPILYSNNIPFLIITGYYVGGFPQRIEDHINFYRDFGILKNMLPQIQVVKTENTLFNELNRMWCLKYNSDKMPANLESSIKEQIRKVIAHQK